MSVLCVIQARLGSTRFPRKALADIAGKPMIQHVVERVREIRGVDDVVLAVPNGDIGQLCGPGRRTIAVADVADEDVLGRFAGVMRTYPEADTIMRITGDCPLLNPRIAEHVLQLYREAHAWYAWNVYPGYTDGEDVEVFKREALLRADREATDPADREHVTSWIRRHYPVVTLKPVVTGRPKTSVDTEDDLMRVRAIYAESV